MAAFLCGQSILTPCTNAERYGWEGVELGTFLGRAVGSRRESAHHLSPPKGLLGARKRRRQHCAPVVELCRGKWRSAGLLYPGRDGCGDAEMGVMASFLSIARFVHFVMILLFLPIFMILSFPRPFCRCFLIRPFTASLPLPHFLDYHEWTETLATAPRFPCFARPWSFNV